MKYLKQFAIIIVISFIGELLNYCLPFPIPASLYGMVLLFIGLCSGIIRLEWIKETGLFLLDIMPVMFIPLCVGLINEWANIALIWFPVLFISVFTTLLVMVVTGRTAQSFLDDKHANTDRSCLSDKDSAVTTDEKEVSHE